MPKAKKTSKTKNARRMVPYGAARPSAGLVPKLAAGTYHRHTQRFLFANYSVNCTASTLGAISFALNQMPDGNTLAALFDEYKIEKVKLTIRPTSNVSEAASGQHVTTAAGYTGLGLVHTAIDYNDEAAPANAGTVIAYRNSKTTRSDEIHVRTFAPKVAVEVFRSSVATAYASLPDTWLSSSITDVPHYALKYCLDGGPGDPAQISFRVSIDCEMTVLMRNSR